MRHINRRKSNLITYVAEQDENMRSKDKLGDLSLYTFPEKEKRVSVWDFKGKEDEDEQMFDK